MIEETDAGIDLVFTLAVKVNENVDDMAAVKIAARKVGIFLKKNI